jgi:hypothetical protein
MLAPGTKSAPSISPLQAEALLSGDVCIWCESAPKAATSHLCGACLAQDPDGALRRPSPLTVAPR